MADELPAVDRATAVALLRSRPPHKGLSKFLNLLGESSARVYADQHGPAARLLADIERLSARSRTAIFRIELHLVRIIANWEQAEKEALLRALRERWPKTTPQQQRLIERTAAITEIGAMNQGGMLTDSEAACVVWSLDFFRPPLAAPDRVRAALQQADLSAATIRGFWPRLRTHAPHAAALFSPLRGWLEQTLEGG